MTQPDLPQPETAEELNALLDRYAAIRDTISSLEHERETLARALRSALKDGRKAETDLYSARLQVTQRVSYPVDGFREAYGDAATFEVANIDNKKVNALVKSGDLDPGPLSNLRQVTEVFSLFLDAKDPPDKAPTGD